MAWRHERREYYNFISFPHRFIWTVEYIRCSVLGDDFIVRVTILTRFNHHAEPLKQHPKIKYSLSNLDFFRFDFFREERQHFQNDYALTGFPFLLLALKMNVNPNSAMFFFLFSFNHVLLLKRLFLLFYLLIHYNFVSLSLSLCFFCSQQINFF